MTVIDPCPVCHTYDLCSCTTPTVRKAPSRSRKHRGYATQRLVADYFVAGGWPNAVSTGAGRSGIDITGLPGLSAEVKATAGDVTGALRQAVRNAGTGLPFVVWRPNGFGPEKIDQWPVILPLSTFTELLKKAGYQP